MKKFALLFALAVLLATPNISSAFLADNNVTIIKGCPNPSSGVFTVQIEYPGKTFTVLVYNTLGEKVFEKNYIASNNETINVDISSLRKGVYFLVYKDDRNQIVREKIITY